MVGSGIQSLRDSMAGGAYTKPDPARLRQYIENLESSDTAKEYLYKRGLVDKTIEYFKLGYDAEKNAIVIPIFKKEELINLRYRHISPEEGRPKYTQEKGAEVWVFHDKGIDIGVQKKWILVQEGEVDAMIAWQNGFTNVISPASGKDAYMQWVEKVDLIPSIAIAYDNDKPGRQSALALAERLGVEKCKEVIMPFGHKDLNDFYLSSNPEEFDKTYHKLIKDSPFFYKHTFKGVGDIFQNMFENPEEHIKLDILPHVELQKGFFGIISGSSNSGKTDLSLNVTKELAKKGISTLFMPFERGIPYVGKRYITTYFDKTTREISSDNMSAVERENMLQELIAQPVFFAHPDDDKIIETIKKAKRIFGIEVAIIDHLDYIVSGSGENYNRVVADSVKRYKTLAQELGIILLVVHHINKPPQGVTRRPKKEDLKGASDIYQVPESVIFIWKEGEHSTEAEIYLGKNKGTHGYKIVNANLRTGAMTPTTADMEGDPSSRFAASLDDF